MSRADMDRGTAIVNATRAATLHAAPRWAISPWEQARGFMFQAPGDDAIVFLFLPARRARIHMWFVFGPLDLVALDGRGAVVALKEELRPWRLWDPGRDVSALLELPAGTIRRTGTKVGDRVVLPRLPMRR